VSCTDQDGIVRDHLKETYMKTQTIIAIRFLLILTILTGVFYTFFITAIARVIFPGKANGSLILNNGKIEGSELIGQKFDSAVYFWSRPSAINYNPVPSGASNYGPTSDTLKKLTGARRMAFTVSNSLNDTTKIPNEMISASGSGLDPDISPEAASLQVERIVKARNLNEEQRKQVIDLVKSLTREPQFHLLGEQRINVLELNIALDKLNNVPNDHH
jgi:potassium-transporting ATPase KdpC subunit